VKLRVAIITGRCGLALAVAGSGAWATLALSYGPLQSISLSTALGAVTAAGTLSVFVPPWRRWALSAFAVGLAAVFVWWSFVQPSHDRIWEKDVAVVPHAVIDGNEVTIYGVRNSAYSTETVFDARFEKRTFNLQDLNSLDMVASYWMGDAIAHIMVSFGFAERDFLTVSIETRRELGEEYSPLAGFFRKYELIYVVGDERDLIGVRTNYRENPPEDVYLYRSNLPPESIRRVFLDYLREINEIAERPKFYNTLTTNCTTNVLLHLRVNPDAAPLSWKVLLSGYAPLYAWERGRLDTNVSFEELRRLSRINEVAREAGHSPAFSTLIRKALPRPGQRATPGQ
jgi:hypothetical protein